MKTKLKSIITRVIALALTFITGSALAATPVAVWNGDLKDNSTKGDYTLSLNGNSEADGIVTITGDKGIRLYNNLKTNNQRVSVIVKYENLTATANNQVLVTFGGGNNSTDVGSNADIIGLYARANNLNANAIWSGNVWNQDTDRTKGAFASEGQLALTYDYSADRTKGYMNGTVVYDTNGLRGNAIYTHYVGVGGKYNSTNNIGPANNLKISAVAIFDKQLSDSEIAAFDFGFPTRMYSNTLATDNETVDAGTYGEIVVPGCGYKATAYSAQTTINATVGSPSGLFAHPSWGFIQPHTIGMWVKVDELPTSGEKDIYGFSTDGNTNNGYKLAVTAEGKLKIGKKNPNGGWNGGNYYTTNHKITAGEWFYLTVSFNRDTSITGSSSPVAIRIYVNGSQVFSQDNGFSADLGGNNFSAFYIGAGISAAGLYGDTMVVSDVATIKSWATNEALVEAAPLKAKVTLTEAKDWSDIQWGAVAPSADVPAEITFNGGSLNVDKNIECAGIVFKGAVAVSAGAYTFPAINAFGATSLAVNGGTIEFSAIPSSNITIAEGATLKIDVSSEKAINGIAGAGKLVKTGNAALLFNNKSGGVAVDGTTIEILGGLARLNAGNGDAKANSPTFIIGENGSLENHGWITISGTLTIDTAYNKTVFTNTNGNPGTGSRNAKLQGAPAIVKKGAGAVTICANGSDIPSITVEGGSIGFNGTQELSYASSATFDFSKLAKTATPILGNFAFSNTYTFKFPSDWTSGETFQLCSGTLSGIPEGGKIEEYSFYCGDTQKTATFNLASSGSVFYNTGVKPIAPEGNYAISTLNGETIADGQTVELTMPAGATLTIDAVAKTATSVLCSGILIIEGAEGAKPTAEQLAALNLDGVTGVIVKKWLASMGVININLVSGRGKFADGDTSDDGMLAGNTPKSSWINVANATGSTTEITEWKTLTQESAAVSGMTFTWNANTVYSANQDIPILNGYLDDGNADGVTLTLTGVPYAMYDVIVYLNTDNGSVYPPITVNGVKYTWDAANGKTVVGADNWGSALRSGVQYGQNALRVSDLEGNVTIHTAKAALPMRACVPAIQIVEVPYKEIKNSFEAEANADVKTSDLNAYIDGTYTGPFTLTLNGGKFIADADFVCSVLAINTATDLTIEKSADYTISDAEVAKIAINEFGGSKITYVNLATIPATAPAAGKTYRWEGDVILAAIPYIGSAYSGTVEIACDVAGSEGSVYVTGNKSITFSDGASYETPSLVLGNKSGVTQNFTQNGGALEFTKVGSGTSTSSAFVLAHWGSTVTYNLVGGTITVPDDNTVLGWDGKALLTIGGEATTALLKTKGIANNSGHNGNDNVLTISSNGTISLGAYGADLQDRTQVKLNGGTLEAYETCTFAAANANGIQVTADSTINVADGKVLTINAPLTGTGNIMKTGAGTLKLAGSLANYEGVITDSTGAAIDLTAMSIPFDASVLDKINGKVKINATKTGAWSQIASNFSGMTETLNIVGTDDVKLEPLCVKDSNLYFGTNGDATYTFTEDDRIAMSNLTAGAIFKLPTLSINMADTAGVAEGYFAWVEDGKFVCAAKKSNSISLKTGTRTADRDSAIRVTDEAVGGFPVAGKFWNNAKLWNDNSTSNPFTEYLTLKDGNGEATEVTVAYRAPNTYFAKYSIATPTNGNQRLTASYLDDGDTAGSEQWTVDKGDGTSITLPAAPNKRGWQFQVSNIPYDMYDLYVYIASDVQDNKDNANSHLYACPVVISCDGVDWTYYAGPAKAEDSNQWEAYGWAHNGEVVEGKNYIRFRISKNSTGLDDISTINITHGTRNTDANKRLGLAGIQIVEIDDDGVRDRVALAGGAQKWHDAAAWKKTNKDGVSSNVDWVDATENPITARVNTDDVSSLVMDGDALATKLEVSGGTVEEPVEFTLSGSGTLTTETIDATKLHGTLNFEAPVKGTISLAADSYLVVPVSGTIDSLDEIMPEGLSITSGKLKLRGDATFTALTNDFSQIPVSVIDITETSCNVPMIIGANQTVVVDGSKWTSEAIFAATSSRITFKGNYSAVPGTFSGAQGIVEVDGTLTTDADYAFNLNKNIEFGSTLQARIGGTFTLSGFESLTTKVGCDVLATNITFTCPNWKNVNMNGGHLKADNTIRLCADGMVFCNYYIGDDVSDNGTMILEASKLDCSIYPGAFGALQLRKGATIKFGAEGFAVAANGSAGAQYQSITIKGATLVATATATFSVQANYNVNSDSIIEVVENAVLTVKNSGKNFGQAGKTVTKTGLGTLVFEGPVPCAVKVDAGTLKLAAGDEANVTVGENGSLTLTVSTEQSSMGYTSTATIPEGTNITFIRPNGDVVVGTGKTLPPAAIFWIGGETGAWNDTTSWSGGSIPTAEDDVVFTNSAVAVFANDSTAHSLLIRDNVVLTLNADDAVSIPFVISGTGKLVKAGEGTLTLAVQNTFNGGLKIVGGVVKMGNYLALGASGSTVEIARGATLDMADTNGINGYYTAKFINEGEGNDGRLIKSTTSHLGVGKTYPIRYIILDEGADAEIYVEADANCGLVGQGWGVSSITLNGNTLTKTGAGLFYFANTTVTGQGIISLDAGTISVESGALTANDVTFNVGKNATLNVVDAVTVKDLEMSGTRTGAGTLTVNGVLSGTGTIGDIVLGEDSSLDATKGPITVTSFYSFADELIIKCPPTGGKLISGLGMLDPRGNVVLIDAKTGEEIPKSKGTLSFKDGTLSFSVNGFLIMLK